ncbi:putative ribonuclease H protein [Vitis vinifera]|uniref:Putative ribonuclease H protein n=1 Tax=Vitis vinifera TaxID=29760 RepID=A0A438KQR0_VITVI|nr:putative ribonuclease H protein [Vitis vinifera]
MVIPVGEVEGVLEMAVEIRCWVGHCLLFIGAAPWAPNRASSVWDGVEERMRRKLALWKHQYLSKGGRITLIKSTLSSIPLYQMSVFRMPKSVVRRIEKASQRLFVGWSQWGEQGHLVRWRWCARIKKKGGLGLRKLTLLNKAFLANGFGDLRVLRRSFGKKCLRLSMGKRSLGGGQGRQMGRLELEFWKEILKESTWCWEIWGQGGKRQQNKECHSGGMLGSECGSRRVEFKAVKGLE